MSNDIKDYQKKLKENINILIENSKLEEAKEILSQYENIVRDDIEIYSIKGVIAMMEGNIDAAEIILTDGVKINHDDFDILYNLAYLYSLKKEYLTAYKYFMLAKKNCCDTTINKNIDSEIIEIKNNYFLETNKDIKEELDLESKLPVNVNIKYKKVLYLGWLGQGNVGDDLLFDVFKKMMFSIKENVTFNLVIDYYLPLNNYEVDLTQYDLIVLGGGSLYSLGYWEDICIKASNLNIPFVTWGTGLDIRDEDVTAKIIKGYNSNIKIDINLPKTKKVIDNAKIASIRGNISKYTIGNSKLEVIGDPGIIFDKLNNSYPYIKEVFDFFKEDDEIILINWGTSFNNVFGGDEKKLEKDIEKTIIELLKSGYKIIIYPIWINDINKCIELSEKFQSENVKCIKKVYDAYGICALIKRAYMTINLKLHANILSMSLSKPFISLGYGMKCYDFCQSVGSEELNIFTHEVTNARILNKVNYIEKNYSKLVERFSLYIEKYYIFQFEFAKRILDIIDDNYFSTNYKKDIKFKKVGVNCQIFHDNMFVDGQNIEIGDNIYIGFGGYYIGSGGIKIGNGTIIAHKVEILTRNHNFNSDDLKSIPYDGRYVLKPVVIGANCWIGSHVCILPGITIGEGAIIGMGAVITKDVPDYAVVAGNPAKVCKFRDKEIYNRLKKENKIYLKMKNNC